MAGFFFFFYKGKRACSKTSRCQVQSPHREAFSLYQVQDKLRDSLFQDLWALHGLKSQLDKTMKEKSIEIYEYKDTLLAL